MKLKPYIPLDQEVLKIIEKHYKVREVEYILNRFCFSNPQLASHQCNNLALDKGEGCEFCKNIPENFNCQVVCDISHVCHSAYACRLGIGGKDIYKAIKSNSEKGYEELLREIHNINSELKDNNGGEFDEVIEESILEEVPENNLIEDERGEEEMSEMKIIDEHTEVRVGRPSIPPDEELLTCKQAAEELGCTLMNIYQKIAHGKVRAVGNERKRRIPRSEVERLKEISRSYKRKMKSEVAE